MKKLIGHGLAVLTFLLGGLGALQVQAAITPNYEVKALLDSQKVLNDAHMLTEQSKVIFHIREDPSNVQVQYLDTPHRDFSQAGWTQRMRHKETKNKLEITYKKRYPIANGDIASALQQAAQDGFANTSTPYEAQIDWGYHTMTLSVSYTQKIPGYTSLPTATQAKILTTAHMPAEELQTISLKKEGVIYGPLTYQKYAGTLAGKSIDIEVWPIPNTSDYITELSFKAKTYKEAAENRKKIYKLLESQQLIKAEDSLKTNKILHS